MANGRIVAANGKARMVFAPEKIVPWLARRSSVLVMEVDRMVGICQHGAT